MQVGAGPEDEPARVVFIRWRGPGTAVLSMDLDPFVDDRAELSIDLGLVVAVATIADPTRNRADVAAILFGPANDFQVSITRSHFFVSSIFPLTSLSWYGFASSPIRPEIVKATPRGWRKFR
jgi:hypothetical protein